jgi:hypothetical protein
VGSATVRLYDEVGGRGMQSLVIRGPIQRDTADQLARDTEAHAREALTVALQVTAEMVDRGDLVRLRRDLTSAQDQASVAAQDRDAADADDGLTKTQIAARLGVSKPAVTQTVKRAAKKLIEYGVIQCPRPKPRPKKQRRNEQLSSAASSPS